MAKKLILLGIVVLLALSFLVGVSPPARAGKVCDIFGVCGTVVNASNSRASVAIYNNWVGGNTPSGLAKRLPIGGNSKNYNRDTDGFCIPGGRKARVVVLNGTSHVFNAVISGCKKIRDNEYATVIVQ